MIARNDLEGLCSTCNHNADCIYIGSDKPTILQCEEFDGYVQPMTAGKMSVEKTDAEVEPSAPAGRSMGLCMNCDNRASCTLPMPEAGVWHCEEYE